MRLPIVVFLLCGILDHVSTFTCDLAPRPEIISPTDPAAPWINSVEFVKPSLEILFGSIRGSSVVLFVLDKLLTNPPNKPSVWDQVKDKVEHLINSKLDQVRVSALCATLMEFRHRIDLCEKNSGIEKTRCYSALLDYMIGKEPHFKAVEGRDVALTLGIYTVYSVMTLSVGKAFLIFNKEHKLRGAARLKRLKPAALRFSTYVNESVPLAVNWRKMEIGKYTTYKWSSWFSSYQKVDSGTIQTRRRRSTDFTDGAKNAQINRQQVSSLDDVQQRMRNASVSNVKRIKPGGSGPIRQWGKLEVTDGVFGNKIFEQDESAYDIEEAFRVLFRAAKPVVAQKREEEGRKLQAIYEKQLLPITNQYWKVYERSDFGMGEAEKNVSASFEQEPNDSE